MKKGISDWRIETIRELRNYKFKIRLIRFLEIIYHTICPILFTFWMLNTQNPIFLIPILLIIFVRLKVR